MPDQYFNPLQSTKIVVPEEFHGEITKFCQSTNKNSGIDKVPFPRIIDFWFCAICLAVRSKLKPEELRNYPKTKEITEGSTLANEHWRISLLMLIAISHFDDVEIVSDPQGIMALANGLAIAGYPKLLEILQKEDSDPIWNLSDEFYDTLKASD